MSGSIRSRSTRVGLLLPRELHALLALAGRDDREALELERVAEPEHDVGLVLDDEDLLLERPREGGPSYHKSRGARHECRAPRCLGPRSGLTSITRREQVMNSVLPAAAGCRCRRSARGASRSRGSSATISVLPLGVRRRIDVAPAVDLLSPRSAARWRRSGRRRAAGSVARRARRVAGELLDLAEAVPARLRRQPRGRRLRRPRPAVGARGQHVASALAGVALRRWPLRRLEDQALHLAARSFGRELARAGTGRRAPS